jgi:hypothetical protein
MEKPMGLIKRGGGAQALYVKLQNFLYSTFLFHFIMQKFYHHFINREFIINMFELIIFILNMKRE